MILVRLLWMTRVYLWHTPHPSADTADGLLARVSVALAIRRPTLEPEFRACATAGAPATSHHGVHLHCLPFAMTAEKAPWP